MFEESFEQKIENIQWAILDTISENHEDLKTLKQYFTDPEIAPHLVFEKTTLTANAAIYGYTEVLRFLLAGEDNLNCIAYEAASDSLCVCAVINNRFEILDLLFNHEKISVQIDWKKETPLILMYALFHPAQTDMFMFLVHRLEFNPDTVVEEMKEACCGTVTNRKDAIANNTSLINYALEQKRLFQTLNNLPEKTTKSAKTKL